MVFLLSSGLPADPIDDFYWEKFYTIMVRKCNSSQSTTFGSNLNLISMLQKKPDCPPPPLPPPSEGEG
jgi:hypothetical protein